MERYVGRKTELIVKILKYKRADYGKEIVVILAKQLKEVCGSGWSNKQLRH